MTTIPQTEAADKNREHEVSVKVDYLPAAAPFHARYANETPAETVRTAAMTFFGVQDRQERDKYEYFLECEGVRVTDTSQPIGNLLTHGHQLHCNLVEQITPGSS